MHVRCSVCGVVVDDDSGESRRRGRRPCPVHECMGYVEPHELEHGADAPARYVDVLSASVMDCELVRVGVAWLSTSETSTPQRAGGGGHERAELEHALRSWLATAMAPLPIARAKCHLCGAPSTLGGQSKSRMVRGTKRDVWLCPRHVSAPEES